MEKIKYIVASDLDGTLILRNESISEENKKAIKEMAELGVVFAPCSGRTFMEMPEAVRENPDIRYYIGGDGAFVYDKLTGERLIDLGITNEEAQPLLDLLDEYETSYTVRHYGHSYIDAKKSTDELYDYYRYSKAYKEFAEYYVEKKDNFAAFVRSLDSIEMICAFFHSTDEMEEFRKRVVEIGDLDYAASERYNIEVYHKRAGKGNGILALADHLGVDRSHTIGVGDSKNDLDMLEKVGISLAMGNALDCVKEVADHTICNCSEHSAKYILEEFIKKNI